ncbi:MAG: helix-hairpin-helix domain-containing protein [Lachnospiraceae bacterium]|nr:helix-hairpin-helix domain-containing protein [Lachnospiraceae bacterium]
MHRFYRYVTSCILLMMLICGLAGCENKTDAFVRLDTETPMIGEDNTAVTLESAGEDRISETPVEEEVYVFVCGQVQNPGVYGMPSGSRICDALAAAGGCLETADTCAVNQAERLQDGEKIYIPAVGEELPVSEEERTASDGLVHLNRATKAELMTLPGIGESKAEQILAYREEHGGFSTVEELMNISGIKEGVFQRIQEYITVE